MMLIIYLFIYSCNIVTILLGSPTLVLFTKFVSLLYGSCSLYSSHSSEIYTPKYTISKFYLEPLLEKLLVNNAEFQ